MVLFCAQRLYYGRDQLDCSPPIGLNHYLPPNKTGAHSTGERFRATMTLLFTNQFNIVSVTNCGSFIKNYYKNHVLRST